MHRGLQGTQLPKFALEIGKIEVGKEGDVVELVEVMVVALVERLEA